MAQGHGEDETAQDEPTTDTDEQYEPTRRVGRRTMMKALGATAALGGLGALSGTAAAAPVDLSGGDTTIPAGEYEWDGSGLDNGSGEAIVGEGSAGDVVLNLESGTMDGSIEGRLENVVVRGANPNSKSGIDLYPGATVDGFVWPEGGQQSEDRAFYTPDGGNDRLTVRNAAWAWMVNNGAYVDKPPVTMENCAAVNNNIANVRVGHRDGTDESETTYIRNSLIAVTEDIENDDTNVPNARGIRLRSPADLVIENCWFIYLDVDGAADLIELHDGAAGSTVEIRDCAFYNDTDRDLVRDKSGGEMDVTIENCRVAGSGSRNIEPDYDGSGVTEDDSVSFPLPSAITGYAAADEIEGVGDGIGPWDGSASTSSDDEDEELAHTIVLHADEENDGTIEATFTVDGPVEYAAEAEPDTDEITENDDDTVTVTSVLSPDGLDSFRFDDSVVDYSVPQNASVDVSVDGTTTTFAELVGEEDSEESSDGSDGESVLEVIARQSGDLDYEFEVDGSVELYETTTEVSAGHGDEISENDDGTVTVTGFTGNDGFGDAYLVDGSVLSFSWDPEDYEFEVLVDGESVDPASFGAEESDGSDDESEADETDENSETEDGSDEQTDDGTDEQTDEETSDDTEDTEASDESDSDSLPHLVTVDGDSADVTTYTFTVSGSVTRDSEASEVSEDGTSWDEMDDIARDGKVIGLVGSGVDAYRFDGSVTSVTVDGDAAIDIERNA
ncbi:MAG: hypothetical protein ACOCSN_02510 [Halanaeroarchaeum sp.]